MNMENIVGQAHNQLVGNRDNSSGKGQLIWKIHKERLEINIVGWLFPLLVWNRPSSSTCEKAPAHLEKSKRED